LNYGAIQIVLLTYLQWVATMCRCQSAATSEIIKALLGTSLTHVSSAVPST